MLALVATSKGLIQLNWQDGLKPVVSGIHFAGFEVTMVFHEKGTNQWWAGITHKHWGQKLFYSLDEGANWTETVTPKFNGEKLPDGRQASLKKIWCMQKSGKDRVLWLGTEPGALFKSADQGKSFSLVESLWKLYSNSREEEWFGTSSDDPFIHSIMVDPLNPEHLYVAVSSAGVFETWDAGENWAPKNKGLVAAYLPNPKVEVGHDPHILLLSEKDPKVLWQQNHCGIFYTIDGGENWNAASNPDEVPHYGFAMAIDRSDPATAWVIPAVSDELRIAPDFKLKVYKTSNYGKNWQDESQGLPEKNVFDIVLRHAFDRHDRNMIFGTTNGNLYWKTNDQSSWKTVTGNLAKINSVLIIK